jgi:hypothetical protein
MHHLRTDFQMLMKEIIKFLQSSLEWALIKKSSLPLWVPILLVSPMKIEQVSRADGHKTHMFLITIIIKKFSSETRPSI